MKRPTVLFIGNDEELRSGLADLLAIRGIEVVGPRGKTAAVQSIRSIGPDLVIVEANSPDGREEIGAVGHLRRWRRDIPIILVARNSSEETVITALRAGVDDYFKRSAPLEEMAGSVGRFLSQTSCPAISGQPDSFDPPSGDGRMVGDTPLLRKIRTYARQVAATDSNVLITGETGTGKQLAAEMIHRNSPRNDKAFVPINCAAIPDTLLESELFGYERGAFTGAFSLKEGWLKTANGGTAFFDEIGDMSHYAQAKILRTIETKELQRLGAQRSVSLNVRVIAATNQDLEGLMSEGKFRKDLYYRLNVARLHLPPLRERKEDIPLLLRHYVRESNRRFGRNIEGFTDEALEVLLRYSWPGNIRELRNLVEAVFVALSSERISALDLPEHFVRQLRTHEDCPQAERDRLLAALLATNWNMSKAAQKLHWSRMTVYRKVAKYRILQSKTP